MNQSRSFIAWLGPRDIAFYLMLITFSLVLENAGLGLLIPLINSLEAGTKPELSLGPIFIEGEVSWLIALVMLVVAFRAGFTLVTVWFGSRLMNSWSERMQVKLHDALHNPAVVGPRTLKSGELVNTVMGETWSASEYCRVMLDVVSRIFALAAYSAVLIWLSWTMTAGLFLAALPMAYIAYRLNRRTRQLSQTILELNNDLYQSAVSSVGSYFTIAVYDLDHRFRSMFAEKAAMLRSHHVSAEIYRSIVPQLLSLIVLPVVVGLGLFARSRSMPIGEIVVFVLVLYRSLPQATAILTGFNELARHRAGFETVTFRMRTWVPSQEFHARRYIGRIAQIELKHVTFTYDSSTPMIKKFSAKLVSGRTYRLHGVSGSGKSTLISIILGLRSPSSGTVEMNGVPLDHIDPNEYRQQIGYAGQRASIFEASIRENICVWRQIDPVRVRLVEKALGIDSLSASLPNGAFENIGIGGVTISGGQRQRLGIARAVVAEPSLIVLDEATSELDLDAELSVLKALHELCPKAIVVTVSHRVENENKSQGLWMQCLM